MTRTLAAKTAQMYYPAVSVGEEFGHSEAGPLPRVSNDGHQGGNCGPLRCSVLSSKFTQVAGRIQLLPAADLAEVAIFLQASRGMYLLPQISGLLCLRPLDPDLKAHVIRSGPHDNLLFN